MTGSLFKTIGRSTIQIGITSQTTIPTCLCWHAESKSPNRHGHFSARDSAQKPSESLGIVPRQRPRIHPVSSRNWRVSAALWSHISYCFSTEMCLEARAGIEPACKDLQSSASPLRHRASRCDKIRHMWCRSASLAAGFALCNRDSLPNPDFGLQNRNGCPTISTVCPKAAWTLRSR